MTKEEKLFNKILEQNENVDLNISIWYESRTMEEAKNPSRCEFKLNINFNEFKKLKKLRKYVHNFVIEKEKDSKRSFEYFVFIKGNKTRLLYGYGNSEYRVHKPTKTFDRSVDTIDYPEIQLPTSYWK